MQSTEQARVAQEVANHIHGSTNGIRAGTTRPPGGCSTRLYATTDLSSQARGLFAQLETELQTNLRASNDRALEAQQAALRKDYNAFLERVDEYRRDRPDAGDGGFALLAQVTQANAALQSLQNRMQGVMSRNEALREIQKERESLRAQVQAVSADIQ
jgi:hypothetical protein